MYKTQQNKTLEKYTILGKIQTREIIQTTRQTCTNIQAIIILIAYQQMYWFDRQYILLPNQTQQAQATIAIT